MPRAENRPAHPSLRYVVYRFMETDNPEPPQRPQSRPVARGSLFSRISRTFNLSCPWKAWGMLKVPGILVENSLVCNRIWFVCSLPRMVSKYYKEKRAVLFNRSLDANGFREWMQHSTKPAANIGLCHETNLQSTETPYEANRSRTDIHTLSLTHLLYT